ncbi:MAG: 23S rRNA (adenine(2503)-C(2))-methyltransferase RlmN [Coriobacteriia bacterium]|nr:23S rRNA (adenine(2503)-C(2))-methyltransferase RlmN [Coriobacteriia bacterium]
MEATPTRSRFPEAVGLKTLDADGIARLVESLDQPRYRAAQIVRWVYGRGARSYDQMTDVPTGLRAQLADRFALPFPSVLERQVSSDGTRKYLIRLADGATVECVGLPAMDRLTVCFSTQAGCAMGCSFCATGASGLTRDLAPGEMLDQVRLVGDDFGARVSNAVAMGQGEPFANYEPTLGALRLMNSPDGLEIGARHLTVSTCGLIAGIERFTEEPEQFTLAVSLHSAVQTTRDALMPGVRGQTLTRLRGALERYSEATGRRPSLEFALVEGANDTDDELRALISFCQGLLVHVNLIPMNAVAGTGHGRAPGARVDEFARRLDAAGVNATVRTERGADIDAACGQLRQRAAADESAPR